ncbi:TIGR03943 family putative permease subunit [Spirillospora sp. NPDC048911]|uniref:TIGR03943 family putative permease subunit n=1 Tax=Spirillospora sp. NPDC048911 TaxID=3364527 RepID=UPI00371DA495
MTRAAQNLLLIMIGAAVMWITLATDEYLNYVKPGFRYLLVPAAAALIVLGLAGLRREWRDDPDAADGDSGHRHGEPRHGDGHHHGGPGHGGSHGHGYGGPSHGEPKHNGSGHGDLLGGGSGHDHSDGHGHDHGGRGPRVAWLLCLPVLAIFVVAPPALGSFTASRAAARQATPPPPPDEGYDALPRTGAPVAMTMGEFMGRSYEAQTGQNASLAGATVQLTGFVTPGGKGSTWRVTRLKMACCAGDAIPFAVVVHGLRQPPADDWVQVIGTWRPPAGAARSGVHELDGRSVQPIKKPKNPYE